MNVEDCEECRWMGYNSTMDFYVCILHGEKPIDEVESCYPDKLTYEQEDLVINCNKEK